MFMIDSFPQYSHTKSNLGLVPPSVPKVKDKLPVNSTCPHQLALNS